MDDALAHPLFYKKEFRIMVLILVVMDDALALTFSFKPYGELSCLNPCCNG